MLGDTAVRFDENVAIMKSGKNVVFDVLVLAVGVRPNVSLIKNIGGKIDKGIIVDTSMRTTIPSIFAAGDCAQGYDSSIDDSRILAIWPNAYMQGYCAGVNMANGTMTFENAIPMNSIGFFGTHAFTAGCYEGELVEEKSDKCIKRLFIHNGFCVGFILIGNVDKSGIYTNLIREKVSLEKADLKILKKQPTLFLLGTEIRRNKLGGVV